MSDDPPIENPFDELGLDPRHSPRQLTELLKLRAERARPEERARLQSLWRQLTLRERDRIRWALLAHPRASREDQERVEAIAQRIPPFISRSSPPPIMPTLRDLLVTPPPQTRTPGREERDGGHDAPAQTLEPPFLSAPRDPDA